MRNRHSQKSTLARSVKNPCPIQTSKVSETHLPKCKGSGDIDKWDYKALPEDDPRRVEIERMFSQLKPMKPLVPANKWRNER